MALCAACASGTQGAVQHAPAVTTSDFAAERALQRADDALHAGENAAAEALYRDFLRGHPGDPLAPLATIGIAQIALDPRTREGAERALLLLTPLVAHGDAALAEKASLWRGVALHRVGRHQEAISVLEPLEPRLTDPAERSLVTTTLAEAAEAVGDTLSALRRLDVLASAAAESAERTAARAQVDAILSSGAALDPGARSSWTRALEDAGLDHRGYAWARVVERAVQLSAEEGDMESVRTLVDSLRAEDVPLSSDLENEAARAERPTEADPRVLGVVLSFDDARWNDTQQVLRGALLAVGALGERPAAPGAFRLVFRSGVSDDAQIRSAVRELITQHRVIAIASLLDAEGTERAKGAASDLDTLVVPIASSVATGCIAPPVPEAFSATYLDVYGSSPTHVSVLAYRLFEHLTRVIGGGATTRSALRDAWAASPWDFCADPSGLHAASSASALGAGSPSPSTSEASASAGLWASVGAWASR